MTDFGVDISTPVGEDGLLDLDPSLSLASGPAQLIQALVRRITTPTGALVDDPSYGHDVRVYANEQAPRVALVAAAVRDQWLADERVEDCDVSVTFAGETLAIVGVVLTGAGAFRLTLAVSSLTVDLLRAEAA